jgi:hypothetical protein
MNALKPVLDFLKAQWISLVSGLGALAGIALLALGMMSTQVTEEMAKHKATAGQIASLVGSAKHEGMIDAEKERGAKFDEQYRAALDAARQINKREPLLPNAFPRPASQAVAFQFQEAYKNRFLALPRELKGGGPPTAQEVQDEVDRLVEKLRQAAGDRRLNDPTAPPVTPTPPPGPPPGPGEPPLPGPTTPPTGGVQIPAGEAERLAAIRKARNIRMYVEASGTRAAFQISPIVGLVDAPAARDMWYAQVGLWVQEDVVEALAGLNEETAAKLKPEDAHVGNMPVKHLLNIKVNGYITKTAQIIRFDTVRQDTGGGTQGPLGPTAINPGELRPSFTGRTGDDQFDLVRFSVQLIVDQRDLLRAADALTRVNFNQLVNLSYDAGPAGGQDGPYLYGEAPLVRATYEFEGFMARKAYEELMPEDVRKDLGIAPAKP